MHASAAASDFEAAMANEALLRKSQADMVLERAAMQLQGLLKEACDALRPFPSFPNAIFTNAIEVDINGSDPEVGCIVVAEDGDTPDKTGALPAAEGFVTRARAVADKKSRSRHRRALGIPAAEGVAGTAR